MMRVYTLKFRDTDAMRSYLADYLEHGDEMQASVVETSVQKLSIRVAAPSKKIAELGTKHAKRKTTKTAYLR